MKALGNPQESQPALHVAATSGKGSICYSIEAILRAHGKQTALTVSPHVYDIRERIQINGRPVEKDIFIEALNEVLSKTLNSNLKLSYFEVLAAMSFTVFSKSRLDYAAIETGFGGRLDATNVISRPDKVCILGQIGLDHTHALGDTLEKIAFEKAGIIQPGNHVIALKQTEGVNKVFEDRAAAMNASIEWVEQSSDYQISNSGLARAACRYIAGRDGWAFDNSLANRTLRNVFIPARFEKRSLKDHQVLIDGAHNPQKLAALAQRITQENMHPATIVFAIGERKDAKQCLVALKPIAKRLIATEYFTDQQDIPVHACDSSAITKICEELGIPCTAERSPEKALQRAVCHPEPIIVTGSFFLASELSPAIS